MNAAHKFSVIQPKSFGSLTGEGQHHRGQQHVASRRKGQFTTRTADADTDVVLIGDSDSDVEFVDDLFVPGSPIPASVIVPHHVLDVSDDYTNSWQREEFPAIKHNGPAMDLLYEPTLADLDQVIEDALLEVDQQKLNHLLICMPSLQSSQVLTCSPFSLPPSSNSSDSNSRRLNEQLF